MTLSKEISPLMGNLESPIDSSVSFERLASARTLFADCFDLDN